MLKTKDRDSIIITGYIKECYTCWIPVGILDIVYTFYHISYGHVFNEEYTNMVNNENIRITKIYINRSCKHCVSLKGDLYVFGINSDAELGLGHYNEIKTLLKHPFFEENVIWVSQGIFDCHSFVYTIENKLYGMGYNYEQQIGSKTTEDTITEPKLINYKFNDILTSITCGLQHSIFLDKSGDLYGCGSNNCGQLSFDIIDDQCYSITQIKTKNRINVIGCSRRSTYAVDNKGSIICYGDNNHYELGIHDRDGTSNVISNLNIKDISVGVYHVFCLDINGQLYGFGDNQYGQIGLQFEKFADKITKLDVNGYMVDNIKCGGYHNIIKSKNNKYYVCGWNWNDCLLLKSELLVKFAFKFEEISMDYLYNQLGSNKMIMDIVPGYYETFILQSID